MLTSILYGLHSFLSFCPLSNLSIIMILFLTFTEDSLTSSHIHTFSGHQNYHTIQVEFRTEYTETEQDLNKVRACTCRSRFSQLVFYF